jgi:hypothetical protein
LYSIVTTAIATIVAIWIVIARLVITKFTIVEHATLRALVLWLDTYSILSHSSTSTSIKSGRGMRTRSP